MKFLKIIGKKRVSKWMDYVKNDVLCTAFSYARYSKGMEEITEFGMKNSLTLPSLGWKYFNFKIEDDDAQSSMRPIYTYTDKYMRWFIRNSIKGGRCCAFNQYYKSEISNKIFKTISEEFNVNGNICDIINVYIKYVNKIKKDIEEEYNSQFEDYRDIDQDEKEIYINNKLSQIPIHSKLKKLSFSNVLMNFDATSLYPSAMWDDESIYPRIETGYPFTPDMNDEIVQKFNTQTFTQGSAILKVLYYNPKDLIFQHIPIKEVIEKQELNRMRNGYILDTLTSVDIQEIIKIGGRLIKVYEGVIYKENFKVSPFKKVIDKLFKLKQKYKKEK